MGNLSASLSLDGSVPPVLQERGMSAAPPRSPLVALEGLAALLGLGDMAQLLKMLPRDSQWWPDRVGC